MRHKRLPRRQGAAIWQSSSHCCPFQNILLAVCVIGATRSGSPHGALSRMPVQPELWWDFPARFYRLPHMLLNRSAIQRRRVQAMRDCAVGVIHSWISLKYPNTVTPVCLNWKYWCTDSLLTDESDNWADTGTLSITKNWLIKGNQKWHKTGKSHEYDNKNRAWPCASGALSYFTIYKG